MVYTAQYLWNPLCKNLSPGRLSAAIWQKCRSMLFLVMQNSKALTFYEYDKKWPNLPRTFSLLASFMILLYVYSKYSIYNIEIVVSFAQTWFLFILGVLFSFTSSCRYMLTQFVTTGNWLLSWNNRAKRPDKNLWKWQRLEGFFSKQYEQPSCFIDEFFGNSRVEAVEVTRFSPFRKVLRIPNLPKTIHCMMAIHWYRKWSDITGPSGISCSCSRRSSASAQDPGESTLELTRFADAQ